MLNITNHQGNASQNYSELPRHTYKNGNYQKNKKRVLARIWQRGNHCLRDHKLVENSMESPQKIKNRTPMCVCVCVYMYACHIFFIHSAIDGHLVSMSCLFTATVNNRVTISF